MAVSRLARCTRLIRLLAIACAYIAWPALAGTDPARAGEAGHVRWHDTATIAAGKAGWGRLARLGDGSWLAVTTRFHGDDAPTTLDISASRDNARSWTKIASVSVPARKLDNGELLVLPDGDVLLAMRSLIDGVSYRLDVHRSRDRGRSWRFLGTIDRNETPAGRRDRGLWEPTLALLPDGALSVLYADETLADAKPGYSQVVSQRISTDGGASWGPKSVVAAQPGGGTARPGMAVMARLRDGRYLVVFEICGSDPQCPVSSKISRDGRHWPVGLGTPLPHLRCGPHVLATGGGRVFATSCQNEVAWSDDAGERWHRNDPPAWPGGFKHSWPALYQTGPGEIAVVNNDGKGAVRIRFGGHPADRGR